LSATAANVPAPNAPRQIRYWALSNETSFGVCMYCMVADALGVDRPIAIQNSFSLVRAPWAGAWAGRGQALEEALPHCTPSPSSGRGWDRAVCRAHRCPFLSPRTLNHTPQVHRSFEGELAETCSRRHFNLPLLPWSALAGGALRCAGVGGGVLTALGRRQRPARGAGAVGLACSSIFAQGHASAALIISAPPTAASTSTRRRPASTPPAPRAAFPSSRSGERTAAPPPLAASALCSPPAGVLGGRQSRLSRPLLLARPRPFPDPPPPPPPPSYSRFNTVRVQRAAQRYAEIAVDAGLTPAQLAYAWAASRPYVGSTIVGATTAEQLAANLAFTGVELGEDVLAAIDAVHLQRRNPSLVD
jgi:hypothetical protein